MHLRTAIRWARAAFLLACAIVAAAAAWVWRDSLPPVAAPVPEPLGFVRATLPVLPWADLWVKPGAGEVRDEVERYVLAGTFQTYAFASAQGDARPETRIAIIDDRRAGQQAMVNEGDTLGAFTVASILTDQVTLRRGDGEWVLRLTGRMATGMANPVPVVGTKEEEERSFEDMPSLGDSRFGKRIADNQWVIQRDAVMAYANEVMLDPRRYAVLFQSFAPEIGGEGMAGFRIQPKGEKELFESLGLGDQDVIRKVNSMQMTNNRRAEYLISEFMKALGWGEESLYYMAAPSFYINKPLLRKILHDYLYLRPVQDPDYFTMPAEDFEAMRRFYEVNREVAFGVGEMRGGIWYSKSGVKE